MKIDRKEQDGSITPASAYDRTILSGVPLLFQFAEWAAIVGAFQFVGDRYQFVTAKLAALVLTSAFSIYIGCLASNIHWRSAKKWGGWNVPQFAVAFAGCVAAGALLLGFLSLVSTVAIAERG